MHSVSFTNEQTGDGVARIITTHNASVLVQSQRSMQEVQRSIEKFHSLLNSTLPFTPDSAQDLIMAYGTDLDIAFLSHKDQTLTLATRGSGIIFLKRANTITELVGDGSAAQGPPERGDEYILTTNEFLDLIGGLEGLEYYFLHYTSAEVVEMMKTYEDKSVACGFVAIQYGTRRETTFTNHHPSSPLSKQADVITPPAPNDVPSISMEEAQPSMIDNVVGSLRTRLIAIRKIGISKKKLGSVMLMLIPIVFFLYLASRTLGRVTNTTSGQANNFQRIQEQVRSKLQEADTEAFADISNIETTLGDARKLLADIPSSDRKKYANEITQLNALLDSKEKEVMRISDAQPKEYFDFQMIAKEASADDIDFNDGSFYILDSKRGKIYIVDSGQRSHHVLSSDKYKGATQITANGKYTYILTAKDGIYLAEAERSIQVIKPDPDWGDITDMKAYTGNIYILDAKRKDIFKYPGIDEKTYGDVAPYLVPELQGNLTKSDRFAIDGSVYVAGEESVVKFTTGRKVEFKLIVPHRQIAISAIYTDPDLEQFYVYDTMNHALYSMNKEGIFDRQWIVPGQVIAVAASDKGSKVFAVTSQRIYEIENK